MERLKQNTRLRDPSNPISIEGISHTTERLVETVQGNQQSIPSSPMWTSNPTPTIRVIGKTSNTP